MDGESVKVPCGKPYWHEIETDEFGRFTGFTGALFPCTAEKLCCACKDFAAAAYLESLAPDDSEQLADANWLRSMNIPEGTPECDVRTMSFVSHEGYILLWWHDVDGVKALLAASPTRAAVRHLLAAVGGK